MCFQVIISGVAYISNGTDEALKSGLIHPDKPDAAHPRQGRKGDCYFSMAFGSFQ